jgi:HlyD family secretion protein
MLIKIRYKKNVTQYLYSMVNSIQYRFIGKVGKRLSIIFSGFYVFSIMGCNTPVEETQPIREPIMESVYASGTIKSAGQYEVFARVNGIVVSILVAEGQMVSKGQALMQIAGDAARIAEDNARLTADYSSVASNQEKINELQLQVDLAYANMKSDSLLLDRQKKLWDQQIGSLNELERRQLSFKNAITSWQSAKLRLDDVKKQLRFSEGQSKKNLMISKVSSADFVIKSEQAGKVYRLMKEKGEMVSLQNPVAIIGDAENFLIELQIDEYDIAKISIGQKVLVRMDSYKHEVFEANITRIIPIMNESSRSFTGEALFAKRPDVLYPNLTLEANIIISSKENALTLPRNYLLNDSTVLTKDKEVRKIKVGLSDYRKVEILEGLQEGEWVQKPKA